MDCSHPRTIKNPRTGKWMYVPCQHCIGCRLAKTREWKLRLMMENSMWKESCFITLTYDDDHLHVTPCGHVTLWPDDIQKFFKRVRQSLHRWKMKNDPDYRFDYEKHRESMWMAEPFRIPSPPLLKNYYCGEYGDKFGRPHFHAIVYGTKFDHKGSWWIHHYEGDVPVYTSNELIDLWPYGLPTVDVVNPERCGYVAGYVQKKIYYDPMQYFREYGCCVFPYARQSQGLALSYYKEHEDDLWLNHDLRPRMKGVSYSMPRYFVKKDDRLSAAMEIISMRNADVNLERELRYADDVNKGYMKQREKELSAKAAINRQ